MKKLSIFILFSFLALAFTGCTESSVVDTEYTEATPTISVNSSGGYAYLDKESGSVKTLYVATNQDYSTISASLESPSWCSVTVSTNSITLASTSENTGSSARSTTLTVGAGEGDSYVETTITVVQNAEGVEAASLSLDSEEKVYLNAEANYYSDVIVATTNQESVTATPGDGAESWCATEVVDNTDGTFSIKIYTLTENNEAASRTTTVTIGAGMATSIILDVEQYNNAYMTISATSSTVKTLGSYKDDYCEFTFVTNQGISTLSTSITTSESSEWCSAAISDDSATAAGQFILKVTSLSDASSDRTASVKVTVDNGIGTPISASFTVLQYASAGHSFSIGQVIEDGANKAVVFYLDPDDSTKAIAVDITEDATGLQWCSISSFAFTGTALTLIGADSDAQQNGVAGNDGIKAAIAAQGVEYNSTNFPAMGYCTDKGEGWYLPYSSEMAESGRLVILDPADDTALTKYINPVVNAAIVEAGGIEIPESVNYWTSALHKTNGTQAYRRSYPAGSPYAKSFDSTDLRVRCYKEVSAN